MEVGGDLDECDQFEKSPIYIPWTQVTDDTSSLLC